MTLTFTKVSLPNGWLGNMAPYPVAHEGLEYRTTEALFQALRFKERLDIQEEIRAQKSPMAAKMVAKKYAHILVENGYTVQSPQDIDNMRLCLELKLAQHPELPEKLLATGSEDIIEDCSSRPRGSGLFWGAAQMKGSTIWTGQNVLGKLWIELRTVNKAD